jgi:hypothetical protein
VSNHAWITQSGTAGTQAIDVNGGGTIEITGGSSTDTTLGTSGSNGDIRALGGPQQISFVNGGAIVMVGGTVGNGNQAFIRAPNGNQIIQGSPTINMTGGASGGSVDDSNNSSIYTNLTQTITAGSVTLLGGAGGVENSAAITAPKQVLTVNGNLNLTGGSGGSSFGGARIGGRGEDQPSATDLTLIVHGNLTVAGGSTSGASIGSTGKVTGVSNTVVLSVDGSLTLNPSATQETRIGSPSTDLQSGAVSIGVGSDIAMNSGGGSGIAVIRTLGDVVLSATNGAITQATDAVIRAGTLTTVSQSGASLIGNNQVSTFAATNTGANAIALVNVGPTLMINGIAQTAGAGIDITTIGNIVNVGTINLLGGSVFSTNGNGLTNAATGVIRGLGTLDLGGAGRALTNDGVLDLGATSGILGVNGDLTNSSGVIDIGAGGTLSVSGGFVNFSTAKVRTKIMDLTHYGKLNVTGSATLAGTLEVQLVNGFVPSVGSNFTFLTYSSRSGDFATLIGADIGSGTQFVLDSSGTTSSKLSVVTV